MPTATGGWLGVIEGYYGPPLGHAKRLDLVRWMGSRGFNTFVYAPKDDPFHRQRWREPYPDEHMREFEELVRAGRDAGVAVGLTISPGLDWKDGDEQALVSKLRPFVEMGSEAVGVLWDDVPPGGADLGSSHARATAAAVDALGGGRRWWTVPTDYAVRKPTPYLVAFCRELPSEVTVAWTGPSVVPLELSGRDARVLGGSLGRELLLWENFPVNDGVMRGVLHLGPYPERSRDLVDASAGVLLNLMPQALANRIGLSCGAAFWTDPSSDREKVWTDAVWEVEGLRPLARASRSWVASPGPDPELAGWARAAPRDPRLREFLEAGCRTGLPSGWAEELGPWLDAWDNEAQVMLLCLDVLEKGYRSLGRTLAAAEMLVRARSRREQVFGIRTAGYPVTEHDGTRIVARREAVVVGENLTDRLVRRALR